VPTEVVVVVLAPFVLAFLIACFREPTRIALPAYAASIQFGSGLSTGLPAPLGSLSSLLGIVLGTALLVQLVTLRRSGYRISAEIPVWLAFLALTGVTVFWSVSPHLTVPSFLNFASLVLMSVLLMLTGVNRAELRLTESALLIGGLLAVSYGLAQLLFLGGLPSSDEGSPRFGNDLLGPNNQAAALLLPFAIAMGRMALTEGRRRAAYTLAATVLLTGVVLTGSRGGLLAAIVTVIAVIAFTRRGRRALVAYALSGVMLLGGLIALQPAGVGERLIQSEQTSSGRAEIWEVALSACKSYCLIGSGWGTFPRVYALERASVPEARVLKRGTSYEPHNIWILAAIETGLLGLLLVSLGFALSLRTALRVPAWVRGPPVAALLGTVVCGIFLSNLEYKFFWMVLVYVSLSHQVATSELTTDDPAVPVHA